MSRSDRPTKADVARLAKVSTATVSYVLNDAKGVSISAQTRETVQRAARQLGYRPNLAARNLARGGSGVVLYIVPRVALGELVIEVGSGMTTALARHGVMSLVVFETEDDRQVGEALSSFDPVAVTSVFPLSGGALAAVEAAGVPRFHLGSSELQSVGQLHLLTGEMRVDHLVERGHRQLAFAYTESPKWRPLGDYWLTGLEAAARARDLPDLRVATVRPHDAAATVTGWVEAGVTAVCAQNDETAFVVQHGIREAGLRCPEDLAVMGVDAIPLGEVAAPPLTTVAFDADVIVEIAIAVLLRSLGYQVPDPPPDTGLARVIARRST
ncbi:LacI family DNA-binding transcriptional regulator [Nocardia sp. alder85J]|uniref:LacI family DNA-binding transcriptional regulator n=1 Tax=Nocardia sp. alder85J TaxID=2862949 RepID=UPI001CD2A834|nr:LacI family DNA-binding transcriptional regulator [Nocardia sp. alder85J]MCX4098495.1 LacI family DNA-binding transcriptional regulator [Nocardia sp. alder85J]